MRRIGNRTIKVKKVDLIEKIKQNKKNHVEEYDKAVVAYKAEALKQLRDLTKRAQNGDLRIELNLVHPINKSEEYDKIVTMFDMEVEEVVELEQEEFNAYVFDELEFSKAAKLSNSRYL